MAIFDFVKETGGNRRISVMRICAFIWLFVLASGFPLVTQAGDETYLQEWKATCTSLLEQWHKPGGAHDDELREKLIDAAIRAEQPGIIEEISAGGDVASMEIKLPVENDRIKAKIVRNLGEISVNPYRDDTMDCVIRRMTPDCFEAWTPKHGWLFNSKGRLLGEAMPPRRDGRGREWHGAFLPDGSWITTDLWEMDQTLTFFSHRGKWLKEISSAKLAPPKPFEGNGRDLIGWARCDRRGNGWIVSIGADGGRAIVFVKPNGEVRLLKGKLGIGIEDSGLCSEAWKRCYSRDLEPKGMYVALFIPSDDLECWMTRGAPGHGIGVGYPTYTWVGSDRSRAIIADGDSNFGFLPGSRDVFIGATTCEYLRDSNDMAVGSPIVHPKTWFFSADGKCRGWIKAAYLADAADGRGTCFRDEENHVVTLDPDLKPCSRARFTIAGKKVAPVKLFTDLKLGFFLYGKDLVLARW